MMRETEVQIGNPGLGTTLVSNETTRVVFWSAVVSRAT